jgi:hypothetical protein
MGIRFSCPNGHKLHVKTFLAGKRGVCPQCGAKILIPSEGLAGEHVPLNSPEIQRVGPVESSVALAGTIVQTDSPSIVISVSESSVARTLPANAPVTQPPLAVSSPDTPIAPAEALIASETPATDQLRIVSNSMEAVSPAVRYVARRDRNRRNQFVFAVMLLVAVIVLAGVLVFVLQRGAGSAPAGNSPPIGFGEVPTSRHVAVQSYYRFNAHSALVSNS